MDQETLNKLTHYVAHHSSLKAQLAIAPNFDSVAKLYTECARSAGLYLNESEVNSLMAQSRQERLGSLGWAFC